MKVAKKQKRNNNNKTKNKCSVHKVNGSIAIPFF